MSVYTVQGNPVMHNGQFLSPGGTHDLPPYDAEDANKVLKVNASGLDIGWADEQGTQYTAGNGIDITGNEISVDTSVVATKSDLSGKQDTLTAGSNITISNNVISATDTTYTAGTGIDITGDVISADTSVLATQNDLSGKQDTLTAGSNITIQNNVISASAAPQVQANWAESDQSSVSYIQNKPDLSIYAESADLATVASTGDYDDLINKPTIPSFDSTQMAAINSGVNSTKVGDYDAHIADTDIHVTTSEKSTWNGKQDAISDLNDIRSGAQAGSTAVQPGDLATVATTGDYDDLTNKPTIPAAQVNSDWNASSGVAQILNKPDLSVYATQSDLNGKQDTLTAGSNISISNNVISATDTTYSAGTGIDITGTTISADTSVLATQSDLSSKQDTLTAGTNIQINGTTISATDTTYSAGTGIDITGTTISADTSVLATQNDLSSKQDTLTAGSNISITNNVISATDTTYSAGTGLTLTGTTFSNADPLPAHTSSDEGKILKVDSNGDLEWGAESGGTVTDVQVNGTSVVSGGVADITVPAQEQSDWTEADSSDPAFILHKPTEKTLAAGSNITITELNDTVTISSTDTTYTAGTGVDITAGVISADTSVLATQNDLSSKQDTLTAGTNISISNNVISAASQVQSDWAETDTADPSYIDNKPDLVDIVAGPGIHIDNPDGNTLRVSVAQDVETVLWTGSKVDGSFSLSESPSNFEKIEVWFEGVQTNVKDIFTFSGSTGIISAAVPKGDNLKYIYLTTWTVSGTTITYSYTIIHGVNEGTQYKEVRIVKVKGIHRIANN